MAFEADRIFEGRSGEPWELHMVATSSSTAPAAVEPDALHLDMDKGIMDGYSYGTVCLYPTQTRFITGVARAYDDDYPPELSHVVKEKDFETAINQINNTMKDYWPCCFCICCGYSCCVCTLGMSLLCPNLCIRDAELYVRALIDRINRRSCFSRASVEWQLVKKCGRSWIEITYPLNQKPSSSRITYQVGLLDKAMTASSGHGSSTGSSGSSDTSRLLSA